MSAGFSRYIGASIIASAIYSSAAVAAPATERFNFDVPAGSLETVVTAITEQARAQRSTIPDDAAQAPVNGVSGTYTLRDALFKALRDTPYDVDISRDRRVSIVRRADGTEIFVLAPRRTDFVLSSSDTLTRTDTPARQIPATVDTVTEEVLDSQNALSVGEALRNIPGVSYAVGVATTPKIGQFSTENRNFVNGLRASSLSVNAPITDVESIQVLKGPAAILTGSEVAGGVINLVPKRATGRRIADLTVGGGSGGQYILGADVGRSLTADGVLSGRIVLLREAADNKPGGGEDPRQTVINPIIGIRQGDLKIDANFQWFKQDTPLLDTYYYDPATKSYTAYGDVVSDRARLRTESSRLSYNIEKKVADLGAGSLTLRYRGLLQKTSSENQIQSPVAFLPGLGALGSAISSYSRQTQISQYVDLYAQFATGPLRHKLIAGFNYSDTKTENADTGATIGVLFPGNPLLPVPRNQPRAPIKSEQYSFLIQDQIDWGALHILLAANQTHYTDWSTRYDNGRLLPPNGAKFNEFLPSAGIVYDVTKWLSAYYSYSNAFIPVSSLYRTVDGSPLLPTKRKQHEVGVKAAFLDDRLTLNLSASRVRTDRETLGDLLNPGFYVSTPGIKAKNYEVSLAGSITPTLRVLAGYVRSSSHYVYDLVPGIRRVNIGFPRDAANLWAIKSFPTGDKQQLDIGLGGNYSARFKSADLLTGQYVDIDRAFLSVNGSLAYTIAGNKLNLTVDNILDRRNFQPFEATTQITGSPPRTFRLTLTKSF